MEPQEKKKNHKPVIFSLSLSYNENSDLTANMRPHLNMLVNSVFHIDKPKYITRQYGLL